MFIKSFVTACLVMALSMLSLTASAHTSLAHAPVLHYALHGLFVLAVCIAVGLSVFYFKKRA